MNSLEDQVTDLNTLVLVGSPPPPPPLLPLPHLPPPTTAAAARRISATRSTSIVSNNNNIRNRTMSASPATAGAGGMAESPVEGGSAIANGNAIVDYHQHHHIHNGIANGGSYDSANGSGNAKKRKNIATATTTGTGTGSNGEDGMTPGGSAGGAGTGNATGEQKRAKRNRYISIACNECKRRKIKCNGETPCLRCGNLNLECQYAPNCCTNGGFKESDEFRQMNAHIKSLQEQVDNLYANLSAMKNDPNLQSSRVETPHQGFTPQQERSLSHGPLPPMDPVPRYRPIPKHPFFRGPTSTAFSLDVAKNTLHNMGYQGLVDESNNTHDPTPVASPPPSNTTLQVSNLLENPSRDPLWTFSKEEMVRLCRLYEEEVGMMYPIVDIEMVVAHGRHLHKYSANIKTNTSNGQLQTIRDVETCVLKLVLAIASITENSGHSDIGDSLFETVRETADRLLHTEAVDVKTLPFLVLVAIYHFHCDEEGLAWRIIGQIARMSIELGLHRRDSFMKVVTTEPDRAKALRLFWSIYVLDRRWSFGTGLPFALQDADIDPNLPEPTVDTPYLNVMIAYSRIGSKVWRSIASFSPPLGPSLNVEEIGYLDYQVLQWQKSIPPSLQLPHVSSPAPTSRGLHRLQILLYLRANQMRILIYRPVLHSASSIQENMPYANIVVDLAKNTIRALTHLNQTTDIYQMQQVLFNYFLISALAVIFLASCHAPVHFSSLCRDEFYMALDLVKNFSNKSWVSKRLWKTIKGLKEVGPRLGLSSPDIPTASASSHQLHSQSQSHISNHDGNGSIAEDAHSSAALAMAGLAGHEISGRYDTTQNHPAHPNHPNHHTNNHPQTNGTTPRLMRVRNDSLHGSTTGNNSASSLNGSSPVDGFQMSTEMTNLFEAALGSASANAMNNGSGNGNGGPNGNGYTSTPLGDGMGGVSNGNGSHAFGGDEELYRQLRDLF